MGLFKGIGKRRADIRKNRPDRANTLLDRLGRPENQVSLIILLAFVTLATLILMFRPEVVGWRVGQYLPHDLVARVNFTYHDTEKLNEARQTARLQEPRVYRAVDDPFKKIADDLIALPDLVKDQRLDQLAEPYRSVLDNASLTVLQQLNDGTDRRVWNASVDEYIQALREMQLVILSDVQRRQERSRLIRVPQMDLVRGESTYTPTMRDELQARFTRPAGQVFQTLLVSKVVNLSLARITPNYEVDAQQTTQAQNRAALDKPYEAGDVEVNANMIVAERGEIDASKFTRLKAEHQAYIASLGNAVWLQRLGLLGAVLVLTTIGTLYVINFQPRIARNHARALGLVSLLLTMLFLAQLSGVFGNIRSSVVGIATTITVAMILSIAYDQRFAIGIASIHAVLSTLAQDQGLNFFLIQITGVATCCFLLEDVRTRSKLIEVGGATAIAMMGTTLAAGWLDMDPFRYIVRDAIFAGAAGLSVGFLVLGILPFVERVFRITTSMTLLELADASHPLLRRLAVEAPGTYNHSLQVATLSEEAAEAIGANSLLCRVASYYHDVGKINKAEYFVENQQSGANRHLNLSPSVSLLIIIGHVKDGIELAKEYQLPQSVMPFIQQHHGTTLVEFFYHRARKNCERIDAIEKEVHEHQYRYPGPKPRSREVAIVMLSDACESACRAMEEPNANRIETLVHELAMKRLLDGQFDECDLTMRELELMERSLVKSLLGLYHGRIQYPSDKPAAAATGAFPQAARTA